MVIRAIGLIAFGTSAATCFVRAHKSTHFHFLMAMDQHFDSLALLLFKNFNGVADFNGQLAVKRLLLSFPGTLTLQKRTCLADIV
ncbi:MAG: hypothetical protein U5K75_02110 [Ahrensia sp.]|nr:hypothetical protein [Ahrensia sp.]